MMTGDDFGNQSYLMVDLFTLANLLVQFRYKKRTPLRFVNVLTTMKAVPCQMYKCYLTI